MKFANTVFLEKEEMLALSELAGEQSMSDYMEKVLTDHITTEKRRASDSTAVCRQVSHFYVDGNCAECGSPEPLLAPASDSEESAVVERRAKQ